MTARDPRFASLLRDRVRGQIREGEPLARHSTYRIGGPCTLLLPSGGDDVSAALRLATEHGVPWFALGLGSNVLLPDAGLDALVVKIGKGLDGLANEGDRWRLGAGLPAPLAARRTAAQGWGGLHKMVGVPGSVGGGVYMNAGCHGAEWAAVVTQVTVMDAAGEARTLPRSAIPFQYRWSGLTGLVVLETEVRLWPETAARLEEEVAELFRWRQEGTPFNQPCCGSVFKNPARPPDSRADLVSAGRCIDAAGLKGLTVGRAQVSPMHANYFVNLGGATAQDVVGLIEQVRATVRERLGVQLETEVKVVRADGSYDTPSGTPLGGGEPS